VFGGIFGVLAIVIGLAIIAWIGYNKFVERLPQYTGFYWWEPFGNCPARQYWMALAAQSPTGQWISQRLPTAA
jgi:hypothetical protein